MIWPRDSPAKWRPRSIQLGEALAVDPARIWEWCRTFAAMLAATTAARGGDAARVDAFLGLAVLS
ncbi:MAG TPA: hypothetical protein VLG28_15640 [Acidimicrobiia bacterium]|nr:hypothetical protein [Acidimicrobiia bacterium]